MLKGNIETTSIESLLQLCNSNGETGKLQFLQDDREIAAIYFKAGEVIAAKLMGITGVKAFVKIFNLTNADFVFFSDKSIKIDREINKNFEFLLLEAISKRDERRKLESNLLTRLKKDYDIAGVCADPVHAEKLLSRFNAAMGELMNPDSMVCVWAEDGQGKTDLLVKDIKGRGFREFQFNTPVVIEKTMFEIMRLYKEI